MKWVILPCSNPGEKCTMQERVTVATKSRPTLFNLLASSCFCRRDDATLMEYRLRLLSGVKRSFVARRMNGMLTVEGLRVLQYACDSSAHHADRPLHVWSVLEREVSGGWANWGVSKLAMASTGLYKYMPGFLKYLFAWPATQWSGLLNRYLNRRMLEACEVAVEYYLALVNAPQVHWMRLHGDVHYHLLLEEVDSESKAAHAFITEREKEVPDRFQAIQSYRSAMAVLRKQLFYINELFEIGMVDKAEHRMLMKSVDKRILRLEISGPVWRPPKPREMLRSLKFMCGLSDDSFDMIWREGTLRELGRGELFWSASERLSPLNSGIFFVLSGGVTCIHITSDGERKVEFQGAGGLVGSLLSLTGSRVPGKEWAVAEGNAVGKGPLVFFLPQSIVYNRIIKPSNDGDEEMEMVEDGFLREAAAYVVRCLEHEILLAVKNHVEEAVKAAKRPHEAKRALEKDVDPKGRSKNSASTKFPKHALYSSGVIGQNANLSKRAFSFRNRSSNQVGDPGYSISERQNLDTMIKHIADVVELHDDEVEIDLHHVASSATCGVDNEINDKRVKKTDSLISSKASFETFGSEGATREGHLPAADEPLNHDVPKRMLRFRSMYEKKRNSRASLDIAAALQGIHHFSTEVTMDVLQGLPKSFILKLPRGTQFFQTTHIVLLYGSLISEEKMNVSYETGAKIVDEIVGPYVLPWLWDPRLIPDVSRQSTQSRIVNEQLWCAGTDGAIVVVCCHHDGSLPEVVETLNRNDSTTALNGDRRATDRTQVAEIVI
jgi:hypothetical protein